VTLPAIGGVAPAVVPGPVADSLWDRWTDGWGHAAAFSSARSALAALLRQQQPRRLWLPSYVCQTLLDGAAEVPISWYAVDGRLEIDLSGVEAGDAVLVVDYFGRSALAERRPDAFVIEDRAQALDPDGPPFGDVLLYSPRKLFGVGDGGLLVSNQPLPTPEEPGDDTLWAPNDARARDPDGLDPGVWRPAFIAREAGFEPDGRAISGRTLAALQGVDWRSEAAARRANWAVLAAGLGDLALWPERDVAFTPLAFPILVADAAAMSAWLADRRIWAPRHWAEVPSPIPFTAAHDLARRCLSLPLDGRYGASDMARIVEAVRAYPR
jgi:dTDP-4-amino-4,6-dideoxygalactose transaminase